MIASITGKLVSKTPHLAVIDVQGIGYEISVPLGTFYGLPEPSQMITLQTHLHVREDVLQLYGFRGVEEKAVFLLLIGVSGVGPKLALSILSGMPLADFVKAVRAGDAVKLASIPGVGKKTAERLALELKDRIQAALPTGSLLRPDVPSLPGDPLADDAVSALIHLGYKKPLAKEAVEKVLSGSAHTLPIESLIKETLKALSR